LRRSSTLMEIFSTKWMRLIFSKQEILPQRKRCFDAVHAQEWRNPSNYRLMLSDGSFLSKGSRLQKKLLS
jgi:hypothetical protein